MFMYQFITFTTLDSVSIGRSIYMLVSLICIKLLALGYQHIHAMCIHTLEQLSWFSAEFETLILLELKIFSGVDIIIRKSKIKYWFYLSLDHTHSHFWYSIYIIINNQPLCLFHLLSYLPGAIWSCKLNTNHLLALVSIF